MAGRAAGPAPGRPRQRGGGGRDLGRTGAGRVVDSWAYWFLGLEDARAKIEAYRVDYNEVRPHGSLDNRTPMEFARSITGLALRAAW